MLFASGKGRAGVPGEEKVSKFFGTHPVQNTEPSFVLPESNPIKWLETRLQLVFIISSPNPEVVLECSASEAACRSDGKDEGGLKTCEGGRNGVEYVLLHSIKQRQILGKC